MNKSLRDTANLLLVFSLLLLIGVPDALAQDPVGGPYSVDDNTVVLMHFDGNLQNAADTDNGGSTEIASPVGYGLLSDSAGVDQQDFEELIAIDGRNWGQQVHINNASPDYKTFMTIADTSALDLTGDWTLETWVFVKTFGEAHVQGPRLFFKPGDPTRCACHSNYFFNVDGGIEAFRTGYFEDTDPGGWHQVASPNGSVVAGKWLHLTFIRDSSKSLIVQAIHEGTDLNAQGQPTQMELTYFAAQSYDPIEDVPPLVNSSPLYIGNSPQNPNAMFLDGFLEELRISNVVRNINLPPAVTNVTQPSETGPNDGPYSVSADAVAIGDQSVESMTLYYRTDPAANFQSVSMGATGSGSTYTGAVPAQQKGTVVQYFIEAATSGEFSTTVPAEARDPEDPQYLSFAVVEDSSRTLYLSFESGAGAPTDQSDYELPISVFGNPEYRDSPVPGSNQALFLNGDSTYLEVNGAEAAFTNGEEFVLDAWFNPSDSTAGGERILIKENRTKDGGNWYQHNYQLRIGSTGDTLSMIPASYVPDRPGGAFIGSVLGLDSTLTADNWYNIVYVYMADTAFTQLYVLDEAAEGGKRLVDQSGGEMYPEYPPLQADGPLRIGHNTGGPFFEGMVDEVQIYHGVPAEYRPGDVGSAIDTPEGIPTRVVLHDNYPNPFRSETTIRFELNRSGKVNLSVFDVLGRKVTTLVDDRVRAGHHQVRLDASELSSGVYFYRLDTKDLVKTRKMILVR